MTSTSSNPEPPADTVRVGRVLRPHGLRGEVVVEVETEVRGRLAAGSELLLRSRDGVVRPVRLATGSFAATTARVRIEGCASRNDAEALRGAELEVPIERVPEPPPGAFWQHELVGAICRDRRAGELGQVEELIEHGGRWWLQVRGARGEVLIPFAEPFLERVDRETRTLYLDLPPGLIETCASRP
jgi:16S rRNA processing protein RimM